jgi:hypothetical protein
MTASLLSLLAFQNNYGAEAPAAEGPSIVVILCAVVIAIVIIAALWKVFEKAGEPGWAAIVPIYNLIVLLKIAGRPAWWIILMLIPFVNFIVSILVSIDIAKRFGKGAGFGIGLALFGFIFYPILGFGDARYNPNPAV